MNLLIEFCDEKFESFSQSPKNVTQIINFQRHGAVSLLHKFPTSNRLCSLTHNSRFFSKLDCCAMRVDFDLHLHFLRQNWKTPNETFHVLRDSPCFATHLFGIYKTFYRRTKQNEDAM